jgi:hypothetical protein
MQSPHAPVQRETHDSRQPATDSQRRFDRGAWLTLAFALILILASAAQLAYRFTLPTDGWAVLSEDLSDNSLLSIDI